MLRWLLAAEPTPEHISWTTIITSAISALALIGVPVATALAATWRSNRGLAAPNTPPLADHKVDPSPPLPPAVRMSTDSLMVTTDVPDAFLDVPLTVTILNKILGEQVVKTYELQSKLDRERECRVKAEEDARVAKAELAMIRSMLQGRTAGA